MTTPLAASDEKFRVIFDALADGIFVTDVATGRFTDVNETAHHMFGYAPGELIGLGIEALSSGIQPYTREGANAWRDRARAGGPQRAEWHCRTKDGRLFWAEISFRSILYGGNEVGLAIVHDITDRKQRQDELALEAFQDELTGLPNRRAFDIVIDQELAHAERYGGPLCLAIADIDHFKVVNDTFGHPAGDVVLKTLAELMPNQLRRVDHLSRWGGEEFTIVLPQTTVDTAEELLNRLRLSIEERVVPEIGRPVTVSFGVTAYQPDDTPETILDRADRALYTSKEAGRNRVTSL